ncbi:hypothetical protein L1987_77392 [Smallanthus sonchifolius]|uniref:Uncharacterized protein n=1 Tax=Smallanthus sonchifolius TaxID=185202 RepID=A0ACB8Z9G0_9ASTR|nr:hypothetical protein L1987_77392 [Smallanthus sonchifolius]
MNQSFFRSFFIQISVTLQGMMRQDSELLNEKISRDQNFILELEVGSQGLATKGLAENQVYLDTDKWTKLLVLICERAILCFMLATLHITLLKESDWTALYSRGNRKLKYISMLTDGGFVKGDLRVFKILISYYPGDYVVELAVNQP